MLMAEQSRPFASNVIALLKRIAQRTSSLVGRACRPVGLVTCIFRLTLMEFGLGFPDMVQNL
jgi:hypothetical protein